MNTVHVVLPAGVDDPQHPSGGNVYDRRVCRGLAAIGWSVHEHPVPGPWPWPDPAGRARLARVLGALPDLGLVLIDGLVASAVPDVLVPEAARLRVVVLLHMPLGEASPQARPAERLILTSAVAVLATSLWSRTWLLEHYGLAPRHVHVAEPGVEVASLDPGTRGGDKLLCVGAVTPLKGYDVLIAALAELDEVSWTCQVAGALDIAPEFVNRLRRQADRRGIAGRVHFLGPLASPHLDAAYAGADALLVGSRAEAYGMVVTEALAHGLPVIATSVGGVPQALGRAADGQRPGLLVRPDDATALASAIRAYLTDSSLRRRLRRAAADRRGSLRSWSQTTVRVGRTLTEAAGRSPGR